MKNTIKLSTFALATISSLLISTNVLANEVTKNGTEITVTEPTVEVTKSEDTIWADVNVNIKTYIPDEVDINEGDTMTFNVPKELSLETNYNFPVYNETGEAEVGQATANAEASTVTTTFNSYFTEHPLDKAISLNLHTKINREIVGEHERKELNFNGTVVEIDSGTKGTINPEEQLYKYGYQDKNDPSVINWVARINYKREHLTDVHIQDTWSDDQDYVDGSLKFTYADDVDPWKYSHNGDTSGTNFRSNGFDAHIQSVDKILLVEYKTKMRQMEYNPTNRVTVSFNGKWVTHEVETKLVGGNGRADGKSRPKWDKPNEAPKYELPEFEGGVIPNDPPVNEKPEWNGGVVPNDPPVLDIPEINIADVPVIPPAPVLELPELEIPNAPTKDPKMPPIQEELPLASAEVKLQDSKTLPKTGMTEDSIAYLIQGVVVLGLAWIGYLFLKEKGNEI